MLSRAAMRVLGLGVLVLISSCASLAPSTITTTATADRVALSTMPAPPLAMAGAPGLSLTGRLLAGTPKSVGSGDGVAFSVVQPELGGLLQIGERTFVGGRLNLASSSFSATQPPGVASPRLGLTGVDLAVSGGHDLRISERIGLTFAGEFGMRSTDVSSVSSVNVSTTNFPDVLATLGFGGYANVGSLRIHAGAVGTTAIANDARAIVTRTCTGGSCTTVDPGATSTTALVMVGTGVRWQVDRAFALSAALWVPVGAQSVLPPPMLSFTVHAGPFVVGRPKPTPPPPPPPAPPSEPPLLSVPEAAPPPV